MITNNNFNDLGGIMQNFELQRAFELSVICDNNYVMIVNYDYLWHTCF